MRQANPRLLLIARFFTMRWRITPAKPLMLLFIALLFLAACESTVTSSPCVTPSGRTGVCVRVRVTKAAPSENLNASTLYETREVDPNVYAPDPSAVAASTLTVTLQSGAVVTFTANLYYDSSTTLSPHTPGYQVLVYRPSNPTALQSFVDQYRSQTAEFSLDTSIPLKDLSNGSVTSSPVDTQLRHNATIDYIGTVTTRPPSRDRGPIEM
jgi:hypothetical protein